MADLDFVHVFEPPSDPNAPILLMLHGTGGNEQDLLSLAGILAPAAGVLSARGKVLERGMPRFFRRLSEGVFDVEDLKFRTGELADFLLAAATHYGFDVGRLVAVGFSNGANIAAALLLLKPDVLSGAILLRAMVPLSVDPPSAMQYANAASSLRAALPADLRPAFTVSINTGLRWSEQAGLEWRDVDMLAGFITAIRVTHGAPA